MILNETNIHQSKNDMDLSKQFGTDQAHNNERALAMVTRKK